MASHKTLVAYVEGVRARLPRILHSHVQHELGSSLGDLARLEKKGAATVQSACSLRIPVPPAPGPADDERVLLGRLAMLLDDKRVYLSVAGGEQLFANVLDASPDLLGHVWQGLLELKKAELAIGLFKGAIEVGAHGASEQAIGGLVDLAALAPFISAAAIHEDLLHVASAGHAVAEGFSPGDMGGSHFPWVTVIVSTVREASLLADEKTTVTRAASHVALDVGGVAGGGLAGAKIGAVIGTALAPGIGTAVGGAVGSIVGAIGGRIAAQSLKAMPLKKAAEEAEQIHAQMVDETTRSARNVVEQVRVVGEKGRSRFQATLGRPPLHVDVVSELSGMVADALSAAQWTVEDARTSLALVAGSSVYAEHRPPWSARVSDPFWRQRLRAELDLLFRDYAASLDHADRMLKVPSADALEVLTRLAETALPYHVQLAQLLDQIGRRLTQHIDARSALLRTWIDAVSHDYHSAVSELMSTANREAERHRAESSSWRSKVKDKLREVERHRAALGMT